MLSPEETLDRKVAGLSPGGNICYNGYYSGLPDTYRGKRKRTLVENDVDAW